MIIHGFYKNWEAPTTAEGFVDVTQVPSVPGPVMPSALEAFLFTGFLEG